MSPAEVEALLAKLDRESLPNVSVNGVIFGLDGDARLAVLLMQAAGGDAWSLPGGYVRRDESVDDAAARMVRERTGLDHTVLRQFHAFGATNRGEAAVAEAINAFGIAIPSDHWILGRVLSVGYVALVDVSRAQVVPDTWTRAFGWWHVPERPALIMDHYEMVERALGAVRAQLDDLPLGATLLPAAFTMPELQRVYEAVLGRSLDRRNFQKRMMELRLVERLPDQRIGRRRKPAYVYRWTGGASATGAG